MVTSHRIRSEDPLATSTVTKDEARLLGYGIEKKGTAGIIHDLGESTKLWQGRCSSNDPSTASFASAIGELPSPRHIDILVQAFFKNVAWHYDIVDESEFLKQLLQWRCLSHEQLKNVPHSLPTNLRSFPALLFQVLALALLFQPTEHEDALDELKLTVDMELSDRAADYSDAGHRIASSFKKGETTLTLVQAELLRACFEKTTGAVTEAWHTLGTAIRDAQELGLHRLGPEPTTSMRNENPTHEMGCRLWLMLHLWDAHMATVLGRPMSTRMKPNKVPLPALCNGDSQPTPRDVVLCGYHTAHKFLQDIHDLEAADDCSLLVQNIRQTVLSNMANLPAWASPQRPRQHEPPWLSTALEMMYTNIQFVLFALHRPFVFVDSTSRANAVYSAMRILESQRRLFDEAEPLQYKAFTFVFATFDAMVLITAVHIQYPEEFMDQLPTTITSFESVLSRMRILQASNKLAGPALGILQRLYGRVLANATPADSSQLSSEGTEGDVLAGLDMDMSYVDWDSILQPDFENVLCPQPMNQMLFSGRSSTQPLSLEETRHGLNQLQFEGSWQQVY